MQSKKWMSNWYQGLFCRAHGTLAFVAVLYLPLAQAQEDEVVEETTETDVILLEEVVEAPAPATTLERIAANGVIRFGYRTDASPFSYVDEGGQAAGLSVTLCNRIAEQVKSATGQPGLKVEWIQVSTNDRFSKVADGSVDLLCAADSLTAERRKEVSFSLPIFPGGIGALMQAEAAERLRNALEGQAQKTQPLWRGNPASILKDKTFAVVGGTVAESWLAERLDSFGVVAKIQPVSGYDAGVEAVSSGKADALFGDRAILQDAVRRNTKAGSLKVLDRLFTLEPFALALARGDDDFRLLVDQTLSDLYRSGEFESLFTETFGEPNDRVLLFYLSHTLPQ